jgi:hypothetical protein
MPSSRAEVLTPIPPELIDEKPAMPVEQIEPPPVPPIGVPMASTPVDAMPPVNVQQVPSTTIAFRGSPEPVTPTVGDTRRNFSFWLGLVLGLALGLAGGAALFSLFMR